MPALLKPQALASSHAASLSRTVAPESTRAPASSNIWNFLSSLIRIDFQTVRI
jgi:hypothetical protein